MQLSMDGLNIVDESATGCEYDSLEGYWRSCDGFIKDTRISVDRVFIEVSAD